MDLLAVCSGGMDSISMLYVINQTHNIKEVVSFNYGQRHVKELECAKWNANALRIPHKIIDITNLNELLQGSALTSDIAVPEGHYEKDTMKATIVPNRNAILLNIAAGYAISKGIYGLALGVHAGDHFIYPDCRPNFIKSQALTLSLANDCNFVLETPFLNDNKISILAKGHVIGVPYEHTWTCYVGSEKACGKCGSCTERNEAFYRNNLPDPLYSPDEWKEAVKFMKKELQLN